MPEGFEFEPGAVRAYAEVFNQASAQVGQVKATLERTSATAADVGEYRGRDVETHLAALAEDLTNLSTHLGEVGSRLARGAE